MVLVLAGCGSSDDTGDATGGTTEAESTVKSHEAFAFFADRYDFEVAGTVIPDVSTGAEPSAEGFQQLAQEGEEADSYISMLQANARRIAEALQP